MTVETIRITPSALVVKKSTTGNIVFSTDYKYIKTVPSGTFYLSALSPCAIPANGTTPYINMWGGHTLELSKGDPFGGPLNEPFVVYQSGNIIFGTYEFGFDQEYYSTASGTRKIIIGSSGTNYRNFCSISINSTVIGYTQVYAYVNYYDQDANQWVATTGKVVTNLAGPIAVNVNDVISIVPTGTFEASYYPIDYYAFGLTLFNSSNILLPLGVTA